MKLDTLERFLAGLAVLMSAAALGTAYLFEFQSYYSAFDRLQRAVGFVLGPWVVAAVTGLIWVGGNLLRARKHATRNAQLRFWPDPHRERDTFFHSYVLQGSRCVLVRLP